MLFISVNLLNLLVGQQKKFKICYLGQYKKQRDWGEDKTPVHYLFKFLPSLFAQIFDFFLPSMPAMQPSFTEDDIPCPK